MAASIASADSKAGKVIKKAEEGQADYGFTGVPEILGGEVKLSMKDLTSAQRKHLTAFFEIASLTGCLMRERMDLGEEALDQADIRRGDLVVAMERGCEMFFCHREVVVPN